MNIIFIYKFLFTILVTLGKEKFKPTVTTPLGKIEGYIGLTVNQNPFYKFEGVQYAKPPVGELRFQVSYFSTPI